jgi:hypothetical protein
MYFCNECNFSFDISKSSNIIDDNKTIIKKVGDIFKKIENKENLINFKTDIKIEEVTSNVKYSKLTEKEKENISKLYQESNNTGMIFNCINCNNSKEITESILLYKFELNNNKIEKVKTFEENKFTCTNPILPRTHDYICKNESCDTNKKKNIAKEAIFFRETNTMKINYICCICYSGW